MGPSQRCRESRLVQDVPWRLGRRICLLKGCEQTFRPWHPSEPLLQFELAVRLPAAGGSGQPTVVIGRANRVNAAGELRRAAIDERVRERQCADSAPLAAVARAIPTADDGRNSCCQRPGCYEAFAKTARSPLQKFCSAGCRQALRRVLIRERRWKRRLGAIGTSPVGEPTIPGSGPRFRVPHIGRATLSAYFHGHFAVREERVPEEEHEKRPFFHDGSHHDLAAGRSSPALAWSGSMNDCTVIGWRSRNWRRAWRNRWSVTVKSRRS